MGEEVFASEPHGAVQAVACALSAPMGEMAAVAASATAEAAMPNFFFMVHPP